MQVRVGVERVRCGEGEAAGDRDTQGGSAEADAGRDPCQDRPRGLRIDTDRIRQTLRVTREHVSRGPLMLSYLDRWEQIVDDNGIDAIRAIVAADDETAREMRNLSPLHVLLTENERMQVLDEFRAWWTTGSP